MLSPAFFTDHKPTHQLIIKAPLLHMVVLLRLDQIRFIITLPLRLSASGQRINFLCLENSLDRWILHHQSDSWRPHGVCLIVGDEGDETVSCFVLRPWLSCQSGQGFSSVLQSQTGSTPLVITWSTCIFTHLHIMQSIETANKNQKSYQACTKLIEKMGACLHPQGLSCYSGQVFSSVPQSQQVPHLQSDYLEYMNLYPSTYAIY